ncbi:MAG: hypothetical protein FWB97_01995 [Oscillospiraceae bacterium]|nr:hypothetical protein [Oscillospiraceae bacterium]
MEQFRLQFLEEALSSDNVLLGFTFKATETRGGCAHLAVLNRQLAHGFSILWGRSAHFCKNDCFECLSQHEIAA